MSDVSSEIKTFNKSHEQRFYHHVKLLRIIDLNDLRRLNLMILHY